MKLCVVKERAERLYSFLNGVAKIRLCKCWQLIYVQLLGNQKCNCSCVLHSKYKIKTLSFQNFVFQENNCLCESFCVLASFYQQQSPRAILSHHLVPKYLPILAKTRWHCIVFPPEKLKPQLAGLIPSSQLKLWIISKCQTF